MPALAPVALVFGVFGAGAIACIVFWERLSAAYGALIHSYTSELERAAIVVTPGSIRKYTAFILAGIAIAWGITLILAKPSLFTAALLFAGYTGFALLAIRLWIARRIAKRLNEFNNQLEIVLRLVVSALRVGLGLRQAISMVINEMPSPASVEFGRALAQTTIGVTVEDALAQLARRMPSMEMTMLTQAISIQSRTGGNLAKILLNLAEMVKQRRRIDRRIRSLTSESRSTKWIITALPVGVTLFIFACEPEMRNGLLTTLVGHFALGLAAAMLTCGWLLFEHLSRLDV